MVVSLYPNPPHKALVLCVDEKPCIQALERAQAGSLSKRSRPDRLRSRIQASRHHPLFAALEVATGLVHSGHYGAAAGVSFWIS